MRHCCRGWCTEVLIVQLRRKITEWLSPLNFFQTQNNTFRKRQEGTGEWLLESSEFRDWLSGSRKTLFCPGIRMNHSGYPLNFQLSH